MATAFMHRKPLTMNQNLLLSFNSLQSRGGHGFPRSPDLRAQPPSQASPRPAVMFALTNATFAFDDPNRPRYENLWRISVLRVVVSFLFRIAIRCLNAHGIWYLVAVR